MAWLCSLWPTSIYCRRSSSQRLDLNLYQVLSICLLRFFFMHFNFYPLLLRVPLIPLNCLCISGDGEGGIEMTESMQLIREFCDRFISPEKATRTRIVCIHVILFIFFFWSQLIFDKINHFLVPGKGVCCGSLIVYKW